MKNIHLQLDEADFFKAKERKLQVEQGIEKDLTWEQFFIHLLNK